MKTFLKSTTALSVSVALALPTGAFAQSANCERFEAENIYPCTVDGVEITNRAAHMEALGMSNDVTPQQVQEAAETTERALREAQAEAEALAAQAAETAQAEAEAAEAEVAEALRAEQERNDAAQAAELEARAEEQRRNAEAQAAEDALRAEEERNRVAEAAEAEARALEEERATQAALQAEAEERARLEELALEERRAALRAERQEERDAAAAAAAEKALRAEGEMITEEVTEEAVRSSSEEFDTAVTGDGNSASSDDGGLSKFEKALLLGLGAVVVGSVLKNGDRVVNRSGDRVVVEDPNGDLRVLKDDDALIRRPGDEVQTQTFNDGSTRTIVTKPDNSQVITIRGRDGAVLRRINVDARGNEFVLFDDTRAEERVIVRDLPRVVRQETLSVGTQDEDALRAALQAEMDASQARRYSLRQVREISQVRALAPELELDAVRFETGSAAIRPEQARSLARIGGTLRNLILDDPRTVVLVEGHTDAVGEATYNLALSDRRAETVALALTEYFDVPPENLITQGYGEGSLRVPTPDAEPANRRAVVRNITGLLR